MYELELTKSLGRTGNCMICIITAIFFSLKQKNISKITFPSMLWQSNALLPKNNTSPEQHIINSFDIFLDVTEGDNINTTKPKTVRNLTWNAQKNKFESWFIGFYTGQVSFRDRLEIVQKYIYPLFNITPQILDENDLVIHIRSGDIFNQCHYAYIQPPLSFYIEVISSKKWNNIYILTEKNNNPCIQVLKDKYPAIITFNTSNNRTGGNGFGFKHDLQYLLGSYNYVPCQSSLCPLIIQLSKTIQNIYIPSYMFSTKGKHGIREHCTWWSKDLCTKFKNLNNNSNIVTFKECHYNFIVYNYDKYIEINTLYKLITEILHNII